MNVQLSELISINEDHKISVKSWAFMQPSLPKQQYTQHDVTVDVSFNAVWYTIMQQGKNTPIPLIYT